MTAQQGLSRLPLQRGKTEAVFFIPADNKLHGLITEIANPVKQDHCMRFFHLVKVVIAAGLDKRSFSDIVNRPRRCRSRLMD
jgi:hypothetical protein